MLPGNKNYLQPRNSSLLCTFPKVKFTIATEEIRSQKIKKVFLRV